MSFKKDAKKEKTYKEIERQMWENNILGLLIIIIMLFVVLDVGGIMSRILKVLIP